MKKRLKLLEKGTNVVTAAQVKALQEYVNADRKIQTEHRRASGESTSIDPDSGILMPLCRVRVKVHSPYYHVKASVEINEEQNTKALNYLGLLLSFAIGRK